MIYISKFLPYVTLITNFIKAILSGNCEIISVTANDITVTSQILWLWHEIICITFKKLTQKTIENELEAIVFKHGDLDFNSAIKYPV